MRLWIDPSTDVYRWTVCEPDCWWIDVTDFIEHRLAAELDGHVEPRGVPQATRHTKFYDAFSGEQA